MKMHECKNCGQRETEERGFRLAKGFCFTCDFWQEKVEMKDRAEVARIDGKHFIVGPEDAGPFRGFGGAKFRIAFDDGRRLVTTNLWFQGEIPPNFREKLPDNARWAEGSNQA